MILYVSVSYLTFTISGGHAAIEHRRHFDAAKLSATGEWAFVCEGRATTYHRRATNGDQVSAWVVSEAGALSPAERKNADRQPRVSDKHTEHKFSIPGGGSSPTAPHTSVHPVPASWPACAHAPTSVHLRRREPLPGTAVCTSTFMPSAAAVAEARMADKDLAYGVSCELWLGQDVGGVEDGFLQGVSVTYDAVTGEMLQLSRTGLPYTLHPTPYTLNPKT